jgi:hypothetical protein
VHGGMINNNAASEISDPVAARARFCGRVRRRRSNTRADLWYYHVTEAAVANLGTWSQVGERERDGQEGEGKGGRERSWRGSRSTERIPPLPFEHLACVARHRALSQGCDRVSQKLSTVNRCCGRTSEGLLPLVLPNAYLVLSRWSSGVNVN